MHHVVEANQQRLGVLCQELAVRRLDVFGSAVNGAFDEDTSDIDVLAEFEAGPDFDRYFALKEGLKEIFGRPVDVVTPASLTNPYFRRSVMATRELVYAA